MTCPPGDWYKHTRVLEFDLNDSRATGWCLDIQFDAPDPVDNKTDLSFMLDGFSYPYFLKESPDEVDTIKYFYGKHAMAVMRVPFSSVVGVLSSPDASIEKVSKKISVGSYIVMGDRKGKPIRIFKVPIKSIIRSFVDFCH